MEQQNTREHLISTTDPQANSMSAIANSENIL